MLCVASVAADRKLASRSCSATDIVAEPCLRMRGLRENGELNEKARDTFFWGRTLPSGHFALCCFETSGHVLDRKAKSHVPTGMENLVN